MMFAPLLPGFQARLAPMGRRSTPVLRSCRQATLAQIEARLAPAVAPALLQKQRDKEFSRERIYSRSRTFWCWIWQILQGNTSCREVVRQVQALFSLCHAGNVDEGTAGFCLARGKLSRSWLERVLSSTVQRCNAAAPSRSLLLGRPLRAIDGSGSRLPDTAANRLAYPPNNEIPGTGFPFLRFTALLCLQTGAILAHAIGSLNTQEKQHFLPLSSALNKGDILVADRAYGYFVFLALLQGRAIDLIVRLSTHGRQVAFSQAHRKIGPHEGLFTWKKPKPSKLLSAEEWLALPEEITVRIIRHTVTKKGFRTRELLIATSLLDEQKYDKNQILQAYLLRWRLELSLDDIKTSLGMEILSCRSPGMVQKELLMFLIAHNLVRWLMLQAAGQKIEILDRVSFKGTIDSFRQWSHAMAQLSAKAGSKRRREIWERLLKTLRSDAVPPRPGRREPRAVKRRPKYEWLNKPRQNYQERPSRNERRRISRALRRHNAN
jgi:hypothetical protein